MTAQQIEAVLFDLSGTLTTARSTASAATLLPQAIPALERLRHDDIRTGLIIQAPDHPFASLDALTDATVRSDDQLRPFPAPDLPAAVAVRLKASALKRCVLVSGCADGISAGLNAGLWTVGTALSGALDRHGNERWATLTHDEQDRIRLQATMTLMNAGAHYVIDDISELDSCLRDIALRQTTG